MSGYEFTVADYVVAFALALLVAIYWWGWNQDDE